MPRLGVVSMAGVFTPNKNLSQSRSPNGDNIPRANVHLDVARIGMLRLDNATANLGNATKAERAEFRFWRFH